MYTLPPLNVLRTFCAVGQKRTFAEAAAPPLTWHGAGYREEKIFLMDELIIRSLKFTPTAASPLSATDENAMKHAQDMDPGSPFHV